MKKTLLFTTVLLIFSSKLYAQSAQVVSLAQQITAGKKNDSLKVRAIYEWVAKNVEYDVPLFLKMKRKSIEEFIRMQQPQQVLATKKAVCMGYSILFRDLCKAVGIKSEFISGMSKHLDPNTKKHIIPETLHAWNAVKINKKWYLTDLTWSAGSVDEEESKFYKEFNEKFYLMNSAEFAKTHYPFDPVWQLSNQPLTQREFRLYNELPPSRINPPSINYADSLSVYESQDSTSRKLTSYRRALKFDPSNDEAKAALGFYYVQRGIDDYMSYQLITKYFNQIKTADDMQKALNTHPQVNEALKEAEKNYRLSRYYYGLVPQNSKYADIANMNKEVVEQNQKAINDSRSNLTNFYKSLEANLKLMKK